MSFHFVVETDGQRFSLQCEGPHISLGEQGVIIGHLFRRTDLKQRVLHFDAGEIQEIVASAGQALIHKYWGGYVAVLKGWDSSIRVLRDPSGIMPCYWRKKSGQFRCSNDIAYVACWQGPAHADLPALVHYLASPGYNGAKTGLMDAFELPAGRALVTGPMQTSCLSYWSPWDHVGNDLELNEEDAAQKVKETVSACAAAWASCFKRVILGVSGGLDSSIVAAAAAPHTHLICLNMYADDAEGDERRYAKLLTDYLGLELFTGHFKTEDVDIYRPVIPHRPWPNVAHFALANEKRHQKLQREWHADAYFSGNGGDNVFCATRSTSPFLDRLRMEGPGLGLKATLRDLSLLTETDAGTVLKTAWKQFLMSRKPRIAKMDLTGLTRRASPARPLVHPWNVERNDMLIGKKGHVGFLASAQQSHELYARATHIPHIAPLLSQPIVELCLSIPTWFWVEGGVDRAVARNAFQTSLPQELIQRSSKGGPGIFVQEIYRQNQRQIKAMLNDGILAQQGFIDRLYINAADDYSWRGNARAQRLLQFAGAEMWVRYWEGRTLAES
jgi:asparagine synthase (glutamine-hydrolysing)